MRHGDTGVWYGFRGAVLLATTLAIGCTIGGGGQGGAGGEPATGGGGGQGGAGGEPATGGGGGSPASCVPGSQMGCYSGLPGTQG
ncbi:hypothetical protein [Sorangium sp. So ce1151]|uniref:hypothetical protein n=1 Tax=Sorangium sp. So ce1151 TaxID=3133332 RepID=UPI003F60ABC2